MDTRVLIVGGGLSGLVTAVRLAQCGINFKLLEARDRLGGRILSVSNHPESDSEKNSVAANSAVDLGPSWYWPGQPQLQSLLEEFSLHEEVFAQQDRGSAVMEYPDGAIERQAGGSMSGSLRLNGGWRKLIGKLAEQLPEDSVMTSVAVSAISQQNNRVRVMAKQAAGCAIESTDNPLDVYCDKVVLALPPRVIAANLSIDPMIEGREVAALGNVSTWMASHAKVVAVYATPFWQEQNLSGDGFSQRGPLMEIHDASPQRGGPYALFGFVGVPSNQRESAGEDLVKQAAVEQLTRMFGADAADPIAIHYKDWALDPYTATELDRSHTGSRSYHPKAFTTDWDGKIVWAGTETAGLSGHSNGYLEGAVESGNRAAQIASDG